LNIPKDQIESGSGIRAWVNATFYGASKAEVERKVKDYFAYYPPQGYDTHTKTGPSRPAGKKYWSAHVVRYSTCD